MSGTAGGLRRTHSCGALRAADAGRQVMLMGWAFRRRDHGHLIFVDLRDREGITQLVFNPATDAAAHEAAGRIRAEFVLAVEGTVEASNRAAILFYRTCGFSFDDRGFEDGAKLQVRYEVARELLHEETR